MNPTLPWMAKREIPHMKMSSIHTENFSASRRIALLASATREARKPGGRRELQCREQQAGGQQAVGFHGRLCLSVVPGDVGPPTMTHLSYMPGRAKLLCYVPSREAAANQSPHPTAAASRLFGVFCITSDRRR